MRTIAITVALLCVTATAWAEQDEASETAYFERLVEGHRLMGNDEYDAALRSYQSALESHFNDALATYFIASAQRAQGNLVESLASFQRAAELAGERDAALRARALFNVAFVQEARRELAAAREAWRAYIAFAEGHQSAPTYVANARARLAVITAYEELDAAYQPVRERIAARAAQSE